MIGPKGAWLGYTVPLAVRLYPFRPMWHEGNGVYVLALDRDSALLGEGGTGVTVVTLR